MWKKLKNIFVKKIKNKERILVLVDIPKDKEFFSQVLEEIYEPLIADKITIFKMAENVSPSLIILSSNITGKKSLDYCAKLKASSKTKHIPLLIIAESNDLDVIEYYSNNADCYMVKPFGKQELVSQIGSLIKESRRE